MTTEVNPEKLTGKVILLLDKGIEYFFYLLFFAVILLFWTEVDSSGFEFPKILLVYGFSALIGGLWLIRMALEKKGGFRRTPLDVPIALYLLVLILSTLFSTYMPISLWGSGHMPVGALAPTLAFVLLYYAFINNFKSRKQLLGALYAIFGASAISAIYGVLQHYGIDFISWTAEYKSRSFGTLGQANAFAALLGGIVPLLLLFLISSREHLRKFAWGGLLLLVLSGILFSGSRSGLLGVGAGILFLGAGLMIYGAKTKVRRYFNIFLLYLFLLGSVALLVYAVPSATAKNQPTVLSSALQPVALERSAQVRMLVWDGAIQIWKQHPLLGSGPETFDFQYNRIRLKVHNSAESWNKNFIKAHNEFLHILATTGIAGLAAYLILILAFFHGTIFGAYRLLKGGPKASAPLEPLLPIAVAAGYLGILVTNVFGFSLVPVALLLYILPALAFNWFGTIPVEEAATPKNAEREGIRFSLPFSGATQKIVIGGIVLFTLSSCAVIGSVLYADVLYAKAMKELMTDDPFETERLLTKAIKFNPFHAYYHCNLARAYALAAVKMKDIYDNQSEFDNYRRLAVMEVERSVALNPVNDIIWRDKSTTLGLLVPLYPSYAGEAERAAWHAAEIAPSQPGNYYALWLLYVDLNKEQEAVSALTKAIELKPDYYEARFSLTLYYYRKHRLEEAARSLQEFLALAPSRQSELQTLQKAADAAGAAKESLQIQRYLEGL